MFHLRSLEICLFCSHSFLLCGQLSRHQNLCAVSCLYLQNSCAVCHRLRVNRQNFCAVCHRLRVNRQNFCAVCRRLRVNRQNFCAVCRRLRVNRQNFCAVCRLHHGKRQSFCAVCHQNFLNDCMFLACALLHLLLLLLLRLQNSSLHQTSYLQIFCRVKRQNFCEVCRLHHVSLQNFCAVCHHLRAFFQNFCAVCLLSLHLCHLCRDENFFFADVLSLPRLRTFCVRSCVLYSLSQSALV